MRSLRPRTSAPHRRAPRRGANAVEFALTGSVLIVLLIGLMESAWMFHHYFATIRAAQRGARIATAISDPVLAQSEAEAEVQDALQGFGVNPDDATVATSVTDVDDGEIVTVVVTLDNTQLVGFVPLPDQLKTTTSLRREIFVEED